MGGGASYHSVIRSNGVSGAQGRQQLLTAPSKQSPFQRVRVLSSHLCHALHGPKHIQSGGQVGPLALQPRAGIHRCRNFLLQAMDLWSGQEAVASRKWLLCSAKQRAAKEEDGMVTKRGLSR